MSSTNVPNQKNNKRDNPTAACGTYHINEKGLDNIKGNWSPTIELILEGNLEISATLGSIGEDGKLYDAQGKAIIQTQGSAYKQVKRNAQTRRRAEEEINNKTQGVQLGE